MRRLGRRTAAYPASSPLDIPGLHLWFRADSGVGLSGSNVTSWTDVVQGDVFAPSLGTPTFNASDAGLNGQPSITFNNANVDSGAGATAPASSSGCTMAVVLYHVANVNNGSWFHYVSNQEELRQNGTGGIVFWKSAVTLSGLSTSAGHYLIGTYDETSNTASLYVDAGTSPVTAANTTDTPDVATLGIGSRRAGTLPTNSRIAECCLWPRELTATEVAALAAYFATRYAL